MAIAARQNGGVSHGGKTAVFAKSFTNRKGRELRSESRPLVHWRNPFPPLAQTFLTAFFVAFLPVFFAGQFS